MRTTAQFAESFKGTSLRDSLIETVWEEVTVLIGGALTEDELAEIDALGDEGRERLHDLIAAAVKSIGEGLVEEASNGRPTP